MAEWFVSSAVLAALLIGAHYLLRGKISARLQYALWLVLLVRLLLPLSVGKTALSVANLLPEAEPAAVIQAEPAAVPPGAGGQNTGTVCARSAGADARTAGAAPGIHACAGGNGQRRTGKICAEARPFHAEDIHACMGLRRGFAGAVVPVLQSPVRTAAAGGRSARDRAEGGPSGCPADANRAVAVPVRAFPARDLRDNGLRAGRAAAAPLRGARIYALSPPRPHLGRPARRVPRAALVQPAGVVGGGAFPHRRGALLRRGYRPPSRRERTCGLWPLTHPHDVPRAGRSPQRGNDNVGARRAAQNAHHFHHKAPENRNSRSDPRASALRRRSRAP